MVLAMDPRGLVHQVEERSPEELEGARLQRGAGCVGGLRDGAPGRGAVDRGEGNALWS